MSAARRACGAALALLVVPAVLATCRSSTEPAAVATSVLVGPSSARFATLGRTRQFSYTVLDQRSDTMPGASVVWSSTAPAILAVTATGLATAKAQGTAQLVATSGAATGHADVTVVQVVAQIAKPSGGGDQQVGVVGQPLANPLVVQLLDSAGVPISGASVAFSPTVTSVQSGAHSSGTVSAPLVTTDSIGQAQTIWTLGTTAGLDILVTQAGSATVWFGATALRGPAARLVKTAGDFQRTFVNQAVAVHPSVTVTDQYGNAVPGDTVLFAVASGGGSVTGSSQVSDATGHATVGSWTVGASPGIDTLTATAAGNGIAGNPAAFTDSARLVPGTPARVATYLGGNQAGLVGYGVNVRPAVLVTDSNDTPVPGAVVSFAVTSGGGSGTRLVDATDSSGHAQVGAWILGASPGLNTMTATVGSLPPAAFTDTGVAGEYSIQIQFYGAYRPTAAESAAVNAAANRWEQIIYRHSGSPVAVSDTAGSCGAGEPAVSGYVSDVLIFASFGAMDGPGGTLAAAAPCVIATGTGLPVVGVMRFDTADVGMLISGGDFNAVVLHEMGHVLGFGTLWELSSPWPSVDCLQRPSNPPNALYDTYFSCAGGTAHAAAEFDSVGGVSYTGAGQSQGGNVVPVENCANSPYVSPACGARTVNSHWRETVFADELMVGFLPSYPKLSVVTVGSLQDLGYTVNYAGADSYTHTFTAPLVAGGRRLDLGDDIFHGPLYAADRPGRIRLVRRRQ
jgi:hypothetical protein